MNIGILGSGAVGKSLAEGFLKLGNEVKIGTRDESKLKEFVEGKNISVGSFSDTASFGEILVLAVKGDVVENVVSIAGKDNFSGKIVIDVTNPLKFEKEGEPPKLFTAFPSSLGKRIQELLPDSKVVKAFNTVTSVYMCNPKLEEGIPDMFIAGNGGKDKIKDFAEKWGWNVIDVGGIEHAHLLESLAMIWIRYGFMNNYWTHAFKLLKK